MSQCREFVQCPRTAADQYQHQQLGRRGLARAGVGKDDDPSRGASGFGATFQDGGRLAIRPVTQDALQDVQVGTGRQRVEEALRAGGNAISDARSLEGVA